MSISHLKAGRNEAGFTLIELSIVLVIIGLIVGGILTGQDLIKAAEQRATLAQIEKYNTAVNTFRNKFGFIPGDIPWATASGFGLGAYTGGGDGNGILSDTANGTNVASAPVGETLLIWQQLGTAGLIDGSFGSDLTAAGAAPASGVTANDLPLAKLGRGNYLIAGSSNSEGFNFFGLAGVTGSFTGGAVGTATYSASSTNNLSPIELYSMDKKVDDGLPNTGTVQARDATKVTKLVSILEGYGTGGYTTAAPNYQATPTTTASCVTTGGSTSSTSDTYAVSTGGVSPGTTPNCSARFRFN